MLGRDTRDAAMQVRRRPFVSLRRGHVALLTLVILACDAGGMTDPVIPENPVNPGFRDTDGDGITDSLDRCPSQRETINRVFDRDGCPDTPNDLYVAVRLDVEGFWASYFPTVLGRQYVYLSGVVNFTGTVATPCGPGQGPFYCPGNLAVYLDLAFLQSQLDRIGDFAPAIIIAHEIGHHTQRLLGILGSTYTILIELQADCLAGRWAATANARGMLDYDDVGEAYRSLFEVGDAPGTPWFDPRAHGTAFQRKQAFAHGLANGAC